MKKFLLLFIFFALGIEAQQNPVSWKFETKKVSDCEYDLIFKASIEEPWHIYSIHKEKAKEAEDIWPTTIIFKKSKDYKTVGPLKESKPHTELDKVWECVVSYHPKNATFTQRVQLLSKDKVKITGTYEVQACTDQMCTRTPIDKFEFECEGGATCVATETTAAIDSSTAASTTLAADTTPKNNTPTVSATPDNKTSEKDPEAIENMSWWAIFLTGFIGGFAALLTPCVFPMIPMNVSFFTKQSKTKAQGMRNALIYALFIIILYVGLGLGVTLIFGAGALHTLSTNIWFNLAFFVLLLVFAASFLGAFEIVLPSSFVNKMDSKSDKGGLVGIFFMAFTLALVSFSCTGPIIGTLLVQAAAGGGIGGPFWGMFGFALALALPFGLFAAFPGWLNSLPKSGGWLNSVKVVLGFLELALALKFASNADLVVQAGILTREVFIGLWIVIFGLMGVYLIGGFKTSHDSDLKHVSVTRLMFAIVSFFVTIYLIPGMWGAPLKLFSGILPPLEYSESPHGFGGGGVHAAANTNIDPEFSKYIETNKHGVVYFKNDYEHALAYAKKTGKPLMVDFTGHACANCRKTEDYVWPDPEVVKRLNNEVVLVSLYVDDKRSLDPKDYKKVFWYGKEREITDIGDKFKYMEETLYGQSTQPLYILLDHNEQKLNAVRGYNPSIEEYIKWMDEGIDKFKAGKK
ncbi:MAG: Cytochrome c-type biosis protein DsbD, protein-disulfide reductase [Bacteroidetes bacterium]|jgi:thiol:disulfide interchange protein DsbD|nr:Cytochrome c-type biosis protein DsbD, protein-disulfide reductase [Bacteroidota bacterium]